MTNMKKSSKERKAEKWLTELAKKGNERASLILSLLENAPPAVRSQQLKMIFPWIEGAKKISRVYKDPSFKAQLMKKKSKKSDG